MSLLAQIEGAHIPVLRPSGGCHNCPRGRVDFVPATLRTGSVLFVGEAPGAPDVEEGEGFVGSSGQLLRREASAAGIPEPWSFTNAIHCRPPENATPKAKEMECCLRQFVLDEVRGYKYVVLAGGVPLQSFFPGGKSNKFRGNFAYHPDFPGQRFYHIYHPAYLLRRPDLIDGYRRHLERLGRVARGEDQPQDWQITRGSDALDALRDMLRDPLMSYDLETKNRTPLWQRVHSRIKSFCATTDEKIVAAFYETDPQWAAAMKMVAEYMRDPAKGVVGSNVAFDVDITEQDQDFRARCGIHELSVVWYEAGQHKQSSLKQLVADELDGYRHLVHHPDEQRDVDIVLQYNAEDVVYSMRLFKKGMRKIGPQTRDLVTRVISPMSMVYHRASVSGMYIREDYRQQLLRQYQDERRAAVMSWKEEDPQFIPEYHESGKGLSEYLFGLKQLPPMGFTEKEEAPTTDKVAVKAWVRQGATYLRHLLKIRELDKSMSTFIEPLADFMDERWRIHPKHWVTSTDTSRPSSSSPNVYNIPRARPIRDLYGAPPGWLMLESDLSQIEFRIMVCLAKDETGIEAYNRGDDAHTATARVISGNPNPTKEQRSNAKPVNFANLYGAHWKTGQAQALNDYGVVWTDEEAQRFQEAFFATYKKMRAFHEHSRVKLIANRGWFESVTGHVYHYRDWDHPSSDVRDHTFRSALNSEAQGPAANICFLIAVIARKLMDERGMESVEIVNSVYDSIMMLVPDPSWGAAVIGILEEAAQMTHEWVKSWFVVPLIMEHTAGEAWGSLKPWGSPDAEEIIRRLIAAR